MTIWTDQKGERWEIKSENFGGKVSHRRVGESDDKWKDGPPPGWTKKSQIPLK